MDAIKISHSAVAQTCSIVVLGLSVDSNTLKQSALACENCKAFFRRIVRLNLDYDCPKTGCCPIGRNHRRTCKRCRFEKCLIIGMRKESVQYERDSIFRKRPRPTSETSQTSKTSQSSLETAESSTPSPHDNILQSSFSMDSTYSSVCGLNTSPSDQTSVIVTTTDQINNQCKNQFGGKNQFEQFNLCQVFKILANARTSDVCEFTLGHHATILGAIQEADENIKTVISRAVSGLKAYDDAVQHRSYDFALAVKLLKHHLFPVVKIIKEADIFGTLLLSDQVRLLKTFAPQAVLFHAIKLSAPLDETIVLFDEVHSMRRGSGATKTCNELLDRIFDDLIGPFRELDPDPVEFFCIRDIALWNADSSSADSKDSVRKRQLIVLVTLEKYINEKPASQPGRCGRLLMLLKSLERVAEDYRKSILQELLRCPTEVDPLVLELFYQDKAHSTI